MSKVAAIEYRPKSGEVQTVVFDVIENVSHQFSADMTEHAVEKGANVTDHVRANLDELSFDGFVSNTPLEDLRGAGATIESHSFTIENSAGITVPIQGFPRVSAPSRTAVQTLTFPGTENFVQQVLNQLLAIRENSYPCTVRTQERSYDNLILLKADLRRDASTGTGGRFSLEFKQLRLVEVKITTAPKPSEPRAKKQVAKGSQSSTEVKPGQSQERVKSFMKRTLPKVSL